MTGYSLALEASEFQRYQMMAERARQAEADLWTAAGIQAGAHVADIGCGPGAVAAILATVVGETGQVAAVDTNAEVVDAARSALTATCLSNWTVQRGDASASGLQPRSFDVVMIRHVLAHNGSREQAIVDHAVSLLRPGGVVYLADSDLTMIRLFPPDGDLIDLMDRYSGYHRQLGNNPQIGLELATLLRSAGLEMIDFCGRVDAITAPPGLRPPPWAARSAMLAHGSATEADIQRWGRAFERLDRAQPRPLIFPNTLIALARLPAD